VFAGIQPELFQLCDLMGSVLPGFYYAAQLTAAQKPDYKKDFFLVEKILKEKKVKGKKFYLVKFLYYSSKFNQWVPAENIKSEVK